MKKLGLTAMLILCAMMALILTGCTVNEDSYNLVFGKDSKSLIPSIGNSAYEKTALYTEEENVADETPDGDGAENGEETEQKPAVTTPVVDDYVDPTDGFDCSDD